MSEKGLLVALSRHGEIVSLSMGLSTKCDGQCGRFATVESDYQAPMCDACSVRFSHPLGAVDVSRPYWRELRQARRARRLEALLTGGDLDHLGAEK